MNTREIPRFALYGEASTPGQELLHIEEVRSRSSLYHWEIKTHIHQGLYQVLWVMHGSVAVHMDEHRATLKGPVAIVVPPSVAHGFRFSPETDGLVLTFSPRFLVEGEFESTGEAFRTLFQQPGLIALDASDPRAVRLDVLFRELSVEFNAPHAHDSTVAQLLARALIVRLAQAHSQQIQPRNARRSGHQALFTRFLLMVEQNFLRHWTLRQYASRLGLSVPRLNRISQSESGHSALGLIHQRLLREACRRLAYIEAPVAVLSHELGFEDPAYFSRFFKRHTGHSPHRWRIRQSDADQGLAAQGRASAQPLPGKRARKTRPSTQRTRTSS